MYFGFVLYYIGATVGFNGIGLKIQSFFVRNHVVAQEVGEAASHPCGPHCEPENSWELTMVISCRKSCFSNKRTTYLSDALDRLFIACELFEQKTS